MRQNGNELRFLVSRGHACCRRACDRTWTCLRSGAVAAVLISVLGLIGSLSSFAQEFTFRHYGHEEGLRNLDVFQFVQDRSGILWAATENGLFRYDGSGFERIGASEGLPESLIFNVMVDPAGRIWVSTNDHLYHSEGGRFEAVVTGPDALLMGVGQGMYALDAQHILFISHTSLMVARSDVSNRWTVSPFFSAQQSREHPELSRISSVFADRMGVLWLGCGSSLCRVQDGVVRVLGEAEKITKSNWRSIFEDSQGVLWVRSVDRVAVLLPGASVFQQRDIQPKTEATFVGAGILAFGEDRFGNILTQSTSGIARWNGSTWQIFNHSNGLNFSDVSGILRDRQGSLWFSTRGHGLERWLGYGEVESWTTSQGLANDIVWSIYRDRQKRVWIGDHLSVSLLDDEQKQLLGHRSYAPASMHVQQIDGITQSAAGAYWMTSLSGHLFRSLASTGESPERFTEVARLPDVVRMFKDSSERIWLCTRAGLYVVRDPDGEPIAEKVTNPVPGSDIFADAAESPDGVLWFVSDHHLYRLAGDRWTTLPINPYIFNGQIRTVAAAPDGTVWIGGGLPSLYHFQVQQDRVSLLEAISAPNIVSTDIQFTRFDRRGWLWVGTDIGVNVFDGMRWRLLTQLDGLLSGDTNEGAFYADPDGSVWIGVNGGASHLLHPQQLFQHDPLRVTISSAKLGDEQVAVSGMRSALNWHEAPLDVTFTSPDYDRDGAISYRYRLVGLEPAWHMTHTHQIHYPAMPSGSYQFEVQLIDGDLQQQSPVASFSLLIRPPWWRTRSFDACLALFVVALYLFMLRWRERNFVRNQLRLKQLVAQRTAELEAEKTELLAAREALRQQATHDAHTGLWNRAAIMEILAREIIRAQREGTELAVVMIDLDHFKTVNDTYGHLAGDAVLRDAAQRMVENTRSYDMVGRYGGEEFIVVMPSGSPGHPVARLHGMHQAISQQPFLWNGLPLSVTCSIGVAWVEAQTKSVEDVVQQADEALYRAKREGRNRILFYGSPLDPEIEAAGEQEKAQGPTQKRAE